MIDKVWCWTARDVYEAPTDYEQQEEGSNKFNNAFDHAVGGDQKSPKNANLSSWEEIFEFQAKKDGANYKILKEWLMKYYEAPELKDDEDDDPLFRSSY